MTYGAPAAPGDLTQPQGSTAVFVDASGRRWRRVRRLGMALAGLLVAYLVLLAAALIGPPALSRIAVPGLGPVLPGPGAAPLGDGRGGSSTPRDALVRATPEPTRSDGRNPAATPTSVAPTTPPAAGEPAPAAPPAPAPSAATAPPRPAPTTAAPPAATARPTARPTPSREPAPAEPAPASSGGRPSEQPSPAGGRPTEPPGEAEREPGTSDGP